MNFFKIYILFTISTLFSFQVFSQKLTDEQIIDKHIPKAILNSKYLDEPHKPIYIDTIRKIFKTYDFGNKNSIKYIVVIYSTAYNSDIDNPDTYFLVIKVNKDGSSSTLDNSKYDKVYGDELSELILSDLNNDGIKEVIITNQTSKGQPGQFFILKWAGTNLEHITPQLPNFDKTELIGLQVGSLPLVIYKDFIEGKGDLPDIIQQHVMQLTSKGFVELASYDFSEVVTIRTYKAKTASGANKIYTVNEGSFSDVKLKPGLYTLEVKNLSQHKRPIRAEISINAVVVLKPEDFCVKKPKLFVKSKDKKGKEIEEDDDDDKNEDHCKRCDPKKDVYTDVQIKAENTIIVKLYGKKDSKIQVTLKKKN